MNAYRESSPPPIEPVTVGPRGLVRASGATCHCTAPGWMWRWWFDVQEGDRWFCTHGAGWERKSDPRYNCGYRYIWASMPSGPEERR